MPSGAYDHIGSSKLYEVSYSFCSCMIMLSISMFATLHYSSFPTPKLDQSTGQSVFSPSVILRIQRFAEYAQHTKACRPSHPRFDIYRPFPTASATSYSNLPIPIPLPSDPAPYPIRSTSVNPHLEEAAVLYGGVPFITRTFSHVCPTRAPGDAIRMHAVLNTFFQTPVSGEEKKRRIQERISGSCFVTVFPLGSFTCTAAESTKNKNPEQYLLSVEQMTSLSLRILRMYFKGPKGG